MGITKNALIRYKVLDKCFRNTGKQYFIEDLIEECNKVLEDIDPDSGGVSLRTVRADIAFMKSSEGWSIELGEDYKVGKRMYYRYVNTDFSINNMPLNDMEIGQLQSAMELLTQFKGMPQFEWIEEMIPKLKQGIDLAHKPKAIMEYGYNEFVKGYEFISPAYNAIFYRKVLWIRYQPFNYTEPMEFEFHPYFLKQYNQRWFLFGYNAQTEKPDWNLALDRIQGMDEITGSYRENSIDWEEYFEEIVGVTKPEGASVEEVTLHFVGPTGRYIETKPLHGSQKSKWLDEQILEVRLSLIINSEFERLLLAYAESVKIIAPQSLKDSLSQKLNKFHELNQE